MLRINLFLIRLSQIVNKFRYKYRSVYFRNEKKMRVYFIGVSYYRRLINGLDSAFSQFKIT